MRFSSDRQRKAVMARLNKFAADPRAFEYPEVRGVALSQYLPDVEGYTGAEIVINPETKEVEGVRTQYGTKETPGRETMELAGEDYKRGILEKLAKEKGGIDYQHITLPTAENRELVSRISGAERYRMGYPVFAREPNEGMRKHKLMPEDLRSRLPQLYSQENEKDPMVWGKFFSPYSGYTLYITEFDGDDTLFGYVTGTAEDELGYASLNELASAERNGLPLIERDKYFTPKRLSEVKKE